MIFQVIGFLKNLMVGQCSSEVLSCLRFVDVFQRERGNGGPAHRHLIDPSLAFLMLHALPVARVELGLRLQRAQGIWRAGW